MNDKVLEDPQKFFWLRSGRGLRSIRELADALPKVSKGEYEHHVTKEKNDFSRWIRDLFGEEALADELKAAKSKTAFQTLLYNHVIKADQQLKKARKGSAKRAAPEKTVETGKDEKKERKPLTDALDLEDPEAFTKYHDEKSKEYDDLADRFDEVTRRFNESMHPEESKETEELFDKLNERYRELRAKISETRKAGKDPFIADIILRPIPSKIKYARITQDKKDIHTIELAYEEVEREIAEAERHEDPDVKAEVDALVRREA